MYVYARSIAAQPVALARFVLAVSALAVFALSSTAHACASCGCGDSTLTAMGVEKPYKNRVRLALEERISGHGAGAFPDVDTTWTLRSSLVASYSPSARFTLVGLVPLVSMWMRAGGEPWQSATGLGDAELSARGVLYRDRALSAHHILSVLGGMKMPTGPRLFDAAGYPFSDDTQPGSGSWDPIAGLSYGWFGETVSAFSSVAYRYTTTGRRDYRHGQSVGASVGAQVQPFDRVAFSLGLDFRWAAPDRLASGVDAPNTGGSSLALTPAIVVAPLDQWIIKLAVQVHVADWLNGYQTETHAVILSTVVDLN